MQLTRCLSSTAFRSDVHGRLGSSIRIPAAGWMRLMFQRSTEVADTARKVVAAPPPAPRERVSVEPITTGCGSFVNPQPAQGCACAGAHRAIWAPTMITRKASGVGYKLREEGHGCATVIAPGHVLHAYYPSHSLRSLDRAREALASHGGP